VGFSHLHLGRSRAWPAKIRDIVEPTSQRGLLTEAESNVHQVHEPSGDPLLSESTLDDVFEKGRELMDTEATPPWQQMTPPTRNNAAATVCAATLPTLWAPDSIA
jgi:hypothetical protein